ncbi:MAG: hypothetical protein WC889_12770 [Myxococcota bacterium]|jgi:hypothetical protein
MNTSSISTQSQVLYAAADDLQVATDETSMNEILDNNAAELLDRFRNGDSSLLSALKGKNGAALLAKLQDAMNMENRIFSFLSQKSSAEHDMMKTIIQNMR